MNEYLTQIYDNVIKEVWEKLEYWQVVVNKIGGVGLSRHSGIQSKGVNNSNMNACRITLFAPS